MISGDVSLVADMLDVEVLVDICNTMISCWKNFKRNQYFCRYFLLESLQDSAHFLAIKENCEFVLDFICVCCFYKTQKHVKDKEQEF